MIDGVTREHKVSILKLFARLQSSVITLLTGTAVAQLILFAGSPLLTRLYEPAAFGQYAMISLVLSLAVVFATGKYDIAVLLPKSDEDAWALVWLACCISTTVAILVSLIAAVAVLTIDSTPYGVIAGNFQNHLVSSILLSGAMILLSGWQSILFVWMNRLGYFRTISLARVAQAVVMVISQIIMSSVIGGLFGLLWATVLGLGMCLFVQLCAVLRWRHKIHRPSVATMRRLALEHANLPLHTIPTDLIGVLLAQFPIYFLGSQFSETTVGFYSLAQRTLLAPMQLIASSVGEVFRRQASANYAQFGECKAYFLRTALLLGVIALIAIIITTLFGSDLFSWLFGEAWRTAGTYAGILIFMFALKFVVSPLSFMFVIAKKTRLDFLLHTAFLVVLITVFRIVGSETLSATQALLLFVTIYSIMYIVYFILSMRYAIGGKTL